MNTEITAPMMPSRFRWQQVDDGAHQGGGGDDGVKAGVGAGGYQRLGVVFLALTLHKAAQQELDHHSHRHDDERHHAVVRRLRVNDLFDGLDQGRGTRGQDDGRNDDGAEILNAPVAEGVLFVRAALGQLHAQDGDDGAERVGEVVHRVQHNGDGVGQQAHQSLEACQKDVCDDADHAGARDLFLADVVVFHETASVIALGKEYTTFFSACKPGT